MDLSEYQKAYYDGNPLITDAQYDYLVKIFPQGESTIGPKGSVPHIFPMYSLQKKYPGRGDTLPTNLKDYVETPKLDGNAVELVYINGELIKATTRGDGLFGEDITEKMKLIAPIQYYVVESLKNTPVQVTGEVIATKAIENSRNLVAGTLNLKDIELVKERISNLGIKFIAYGLNPTINMYYGIDLEELENDGFLTPLSKVVQEHIQSGCIKTDGTVYRLDNHLNFQELGYTAKFPRGAFAVKVDAEHVKTKLINVIWETGRTGKVTPTAILEPVVIDGATISRATLNNVKFIEDLDLDIGDTVHIIRSGEIIPTIVGKD